MSNTLTRFRSAAQEDDNARLSFAQPKIEVVALLTAVDTLHHHGLTVYVTRQVRPVADDFLEGEPASLTAQDYRVYAGDYGILKEIPVIAINDETNPKTPDLHIKTALGEVFLPQSTRQSPYYNYIKMYDATDQIEVTRIDGGLMTAHK